MYIVDSESNELISAVSSTFKDLKLKERQHLQEWIAKSPSVLGEELLIIQKEFDGFSDTHERLDLLALDKKGNVVVIENKLDDSGRDVTWQAIKYASYCSSLSKDEIIDIYAKYIGKNKSEAEHSLLSFFEAEDFEDVNLNIENTQRIIFVAANFRKEITSSVLWLRGFGIDASCIKVSPYTYNGKIMVEFDRIIPIVDAEDYTIKMARKKKEESQQAESTRKRHTERSDFWEKFIAYNQEVNGDYAASAGTPDSWLGKGGIGIPGVSVNIVIGKDKSRSEIYINTGEKSYNKKVYDFFYSYKNEIEAELGEMCWERIDEKVTCRISQTKQLSYCNEDEHHEIFDFFVTSTAKYIKIFSKVAKNFKK